MAAPAGGAPPVGDGFPHGAPTTLETLLQGGFRADLNRMAETARRFGTLSGELRSLTNRPGQFAGASGSTDVDRALDGFLGAWSTELDRTANDFDELGSRLSAAGTAYREADDSVRRNASART